MTYMKQIAKHVREFYFGKNWTWSNLEEQLSDVTVEEATHRMTGIHSILALTYHIHYYVQAVTKVLEGGPLEAHDTFSFDHPPIQTEKEWQTLLKTMFKEAEHFSYLIEQVSDSKINDFLAEEKYGDYFRNLHGILEHGHYHLGQIVIIKKMIRSR